MDVSFFIRGLLIGFSIAAPVGPIGVLCISRTLDKGRVYGLVTGLGAATADGFYGFIAGFGLTIVSSFLVNFQSWIRLIGGLFLLYLGLKTILTKPAKRAAVVASTNNYFGAYASTVFLTLANPSTILSFVAIFAGAGLAGTNRSYLSAALLVSGVFVGSAFWWFILSGGMSVLQRKVTPKWLLWINRISGTVLLLFGILALISLKW